MSKLLYNMHAFALFLMDSLTHWKMPEVIQIISQESVFSDTMFIEKTPWEEIY